MLETYMRFATIATPILIFVVVVMLLVIHNRKKEYEKEIDRHRRHGDNSHNHRERVRRRADHRKTEKVEDGTFTYSRTTIIRNGKVVTDTSEGEALSPEVQKEIDALFDKVNAAHENVGDSITKIFDAVNSKGKQ